MTRNIETPTRAYTYVLPVFTEYVKIDKKLLVNCFLGAEDVSENYDGSAYLVFKFDEEKIEYENYLSKHELCNKYIDLNEKYYLIGFDVPSNYFSSVYVKYIKGKFSHFPAEYKKKILKYHNLDITSKQFKILYNHDSLKKEISQKLNVSEEYISEVGEMPEYKENCLYNYMYQENTVKQ